MPNYKPLTDYLIQNNIITLDTLNMLQLEAKLKKVSIVQMLENKQILSEKRLIQLISEIHDVPRIHLEDTDVSKKAKRLFSGNLLKKFGFIPISMTSIGDKKKKELFVVFRDPLDQKLISCIETTLGVSIKAGIAPHKEIIQTIHEEFNDTYKSKTQIAQLNKVSATINAFNIYLLYNDLVDHKELI